MKDAFNINPLISTLVSTLIGYLLIDDLTANEQNTLGNWLMLAAQVLITNGTSQALIEQRLSGDVININANENKDEYCPPIYDIQTIREILKKTNPNHTKNAIALLQKAINIIQKDINDIKKSLNQ